MRHLLVPSLLLFVTACRDDGEGEALAHQIDDAREHVDALRTEVEDHAAAVEAATDLAALQALEESHGAMADEHMEMLGHAIGDMDMCEAAPDDQVHAMMQVHEMCDDEMGHHARAIAEALDLAAARTEEDRHHTAMMDRLADLDGMAHDLMDGHGTMMCGGHHGMDDHP
jgi:hypothetical protein